MTYTISSIENNELTYIDRDEYNKRLNELGERSFINRHWHLLCVLMGILSMAIPMGVSITLINMNRINDNDWRALVVTAIAFAISIWFMFLAVDFSPHAKKLIKLQNELNSTAKLPSQIASSHGQMRKSFNPCDADLSSDEADEYVKTAIANDENRLIEVHDRLAKTHIGV